MCKAMVHRDRLDQATPGNPHRRGQNQIRFVDTRTRYRQESSPSSTVVSAWVRSKIKRWYRRHSVSDENGIGSNSLLQAGHRQLRQTHHGSTAQYSPSSSSKFVNVQVSQKACSRSVTGGRITVGTIRSRRRAGLIYTHAVVVLWPGGP
jgi:hypothetical protein